jgi:WD40 repeat protein
VDPANPRLLLSAGDDGKIRISNWTKVNGPELAVFPSKGSIWPIRSAAFSQDGQLVLSGSADGYTRVWDLKGRQIGSRLGFGSAVNSVAFNHHGTKIMDAGDDGSAYLWNAKSRAYTGLLTEPGSPILRRAVFSPDDQSVLTGSTDGIARLWDANTQNQLLAFAGHAGPVNDVAFSTDGTSVATASADGTVRLWRALPREQQGFPFSGPASTVTAAFDPKNGRSIATASSNGALELWNTLTRTHLRISQPSGGGGDSAEFSQDGRWLVSTGGNASARIWNTTTYTNPVVLDTDRAHCSSAQGVTANSLNTANFSPDGRMVVTGSADGTGCIWNWNVSTHSASLLGKFSEPAGSTLGVANVGASGLRWAVFSPDNRRVLTASDDGTARVWNVATRSQVAVFAEPGGEGMNAAWFSPDGKLIVTASNDGTARIWNVATGRQLQVLREPGRSQVFNAAFSPDGTKVVTCAGTARIWSVATGRQLTEFQYGNTLSDCEFSPDRQGKLVMTAGTDGKTRIFTTELAGSLSSIERIAAQRVTRHQLTADEQRTYLAGS